MDTMQVTLATLIAHMEGFYSSDKTVRPIRNNNPGDLDYESWQKAYGAVLETIPKGYKSVARFAYFSNVDSGWNALHDLLTGGPHSNSSYPNKTLEQCIYTFAPPNENNTQLYLKIIQSALHCKLTDLVKDIYR